jgi:hypothetical protein
VRKRETESVGVCGQVVVIASTDVSRFAQAAHLEQGLSQRRQRARDAFVVD